MEAFTRKSLKKVTADKQILMRAVFSSLQQNVSSEKKLNSYDDVKAKAQFDYKLKIRAWRMLVLDFNKDTPRYMSQYLTLADTQRQTTYYSTTVKS